SPTPDRWDIGLLTGTGLSLAALLLVSNSAVYWIAANVWQLGAAEAQTLVFVWMVFAGSQGILYLTRGRGSVWSKPYPSRWVVVATALDIGVVTALATQGWLMAPISLSLVGGLLLLAACFVVAANLLKSLWLR